MINTSQRPQISVMAGPPSDANQEALNRVQETAIRQGLQGRRTGSANMNNESAVMLRAFRHNHPNVAVQPLPVIRSVLCDGTAQVIDVPSAAIAVRFTQSFGKNIAIGIIGGVNIGNLSVDAWINPGTVDGWFFCAGKSQFDVSGDAGAFISAMFYIQDDLSGALPTDAI